MSDTNGFLRRQYDAQLDGVVRDLDRLRGLVLHAKRVDPTNGTRPFTREAERVLADVLATLPNMALHRLIDVAADCDALWERPAEAPGVTQPEPPERAT